MTMMTPIEGITAPIRTTGDLAGIRVLTDESYADKQARIAAEDQSDAIAAADPFVRQAAKEGRVFTPSRRHDGWTPDRQRGFLAYLAEGLTVGDAATLVGLSPASAYAFRTRAAGAAFNIGWSAALLLQRNRLVDDLTSRAFRGQSETVTHPNGEVTERHRYDNSLGLRLLARLDKVAAADLPDRTGDARAARLAAQEWDRYLDLIADDAGPARAGMFLALRVTEGESAALAPIAALGRADLYARARAGVPAEVDIADLDPANRASWTAEQWTRAEAAGLIALAPEVESAPETPSGSQLSQHSRGKMVEAPRIWWCQSADAWRTDYPPPDGFFGEEDGDYGDDGYERELDDDEREALEARHKAEVAVRRGDEERERDETFDRLRADGSMTDLADAAGAEAAQLDRAEPCDGAAGGATAPTDGTEFTSVPPLDDVAQTDLADASRVIDPNSPAKDDDMSIFSKIKDAIFGKDGGPFGDNYLGGKKDQPTARAPTGAAPTAAPAAPPPVMPKAGEPASTPQPPVDAAAALDAIAAKKGNPDLNYKTSIVDLMKLLDLDSSLQNREELAGELGYTGAKDGSAEMNIWLHKAVMAELAKGGGAVPAHLKD